MTNNWSRVKLEIVLFCFVVKILCMSYTAGLVFSQCYHSDLKILRTAGTAIRVWQYNINWRSEFWNTPSRLAGQHQYACSSCSKSCAPQRLTLFLVDVDQTVVCHSAALTATVEKLWISHVKAAGLTFDMDSVRCVFNTGLYFKSWWIFSSISLFYTARKKLCTVYTHCAPSSSMH